MASPLLLNATNATLAALTPDTVALGTMPAPDMYRALATKFSLYHQDPANIFAHLITTPLGFVAVACIINRATRGAYLTAMASLAYLLALVPILNPLVLAGTAALVLAINVAAVRLRLTVIMSLVLLIATYFLQDLAHYLTGEATFQSTYSAGGHIDLANIQLWSAMFYEHCYFLLPLCVEVSLPTPVKALVASAPAWLILANQHIVATADSLMNLFHTKFHPDRWAVEVVEGMNEIYISAPNAKGTSDQVFYTEHVDGPFGLFPFASVFRCIVGMDANRAYATHFPMAGLSTAVATGDALAFDFNREPHYITRTPELQKADLPPDLGGDGRRVVLKIHYCVYPRQLLPLGKLLHLANVLYNMCFRALFLATIKPPETPLEILSGQVVVQMTRLVNAFQRFVGFPNALYLGVLAYLASPYGLNCYTLFLAGTAWIHYLRYIATFYWRRNINFEAFKRDVLLFKSVSLAQLGFLYLARLDLAHPDWLSLSLIATGYTLSILATKALGIDRTYFGVELGFCEPKWITAFPYGTIPHPMIVSQMLALAGFLKLAALRQDYAWLIAGHIGLYFCHMVQEHFDFHRAGKFSLAALFSLGGETEQVLRQRKKTQ
ncbi:uncharacterized protein MONBRDRAFT_33820 [Monosiga brevicollis MX1]|uniref:phosphatidyl-N-methylethanolamine N-methyltransferase n=1 Tax=Monosiga brevicollis TaxID=81824 RepID=A9V7R1_MONBE|nr:uncharacterized protein MONBRDRAFT_33820 [Monosiga brevicollis MX1]EDQ86350.1 predicted protein [Monosiga brevicollis MX1]|eukprot:XP_001748740.1 hypothetical protein [Monosiga brevicollis MX1]